MKSYRNRTRWIEGGDQSEEIELIKRLKCPSSYSLFVYIK